MKRTTQQALRRLRKVQDNIFNGKLAGLGASMDISDLAADFDPSYPGSAFFSISVQKVKKHAPRGRACECFNFTDNSTQEEIDTMLESIGKFFNYQF